jgi:uncharacterized membrane protein
VTGTGTPTKHEVPQSAWVLGWACLAAQLASMAERGTTDGGSALISVPLSALVVAWVSYGVLRARMVRVWFAGILLLLIALFSIVGLFSDASLPAVVGAVASVVAFAALLVYTRGDCFARLREEPRGPGPAFGGLVAIAVVVGALGGLAASTGADEQAGFHVRIGL